MKVTEKEINIFLEARRTSEVWHHIARNMISADPFNFQHKYQEALDGDKSAIGSVRNRLRTLRAKTK